MSTNVSAHTGRCLCGAIRYRVEGEPVVVAHCHCEDCQRLSGAGHATGAMFLRAGLTLEGELSQHQLEGTSGSLVTRTFCGNCGSPIYGTNSRTPEHITLTLGTLDDASAFKPQVAIFARNRHPWDVMDPDLPTYDTQPEWRPEDGV